MELFLPTTAPEEVAPIALEVSALMSSTVPETITWAFAVTGPSNMAKTAM